MFEYIRTHQRLMMFILTVLIIPPFALFGIDGYIRMADNDNVIAKVEGIKITQPMFEAEQRQSFERLRRNMGESFNPAQFDTPEVRQQILDGLVRRLLLERSLAQDYVNVSDDRLRETIASEPALQTNGKFDVEKYKTALAGRGMTSSVFEQGVRYELLNRSYGNLVAKTAFLPRTVADRLLSITTQQREVQTLLLSSASFLDQVKVDDAAIKAYYEANAKKLEIPEQASIEYVALELANISGQIAVKEEDIAAFYKQNEARFGTPEERRASHILITGPADAKAEDKAKARKQAEEILAKVKANPSDFPKLAKEFSQDPGSAAQGGDLGYFGRNMMAKPFEDSAFSLKEKKISGIVESEFGFHIIQLTAIKPAQIQSLAAVRSQIEAELRRNEAGRKYTEAADQFTNMVYEQSDSLQPVVARFNLKMHTLSPVSRQGLPGQAKSELLTDKLLNAIFSDDVLKKHRNTVAVEVAPNILVSARVTDYKPASLRPLSEVQEEIKRSLQQQEAQKLAAKAGTEKLAALLKQPNDQGFGAKSWVSRMAPKDVEWSALREIFKADTGQLPALVGVDLGARGYAIYRITQVGTVALDDAKKAQVQNEVQRIGMLLGGVQEEAAYGVLKARSKVKMLAAPANATAAPGVGS